MQAKDKERNKKDETSKESKEADNSKINLLANHVLIPDDWGQTENFLDLNHLNLSNDEEKKDEDGDTIPELIPWEDESLDTWENVPDFPQADYQPWVFLDDIRTIKTLFKKMYGW